MQAQLALFNLDNATKQITLENKSRVSLFRANDPEHIKALNLKPVSEIREDFKKQGLRGNALTAAVKEANFSQLGVTNGRGRTIEAAFEDAGGKMTKLDVHRTKSGLTHLLSRRSLQTPATPEMRLAQLKAKAAADQAAIAKLELEVSTVTVS